MSPIPITIWYANVSCLVKIPPGALPREGDDISFQLNPNSTKVTYGKVDSIEWEFRRDQPMRLVVYVDPLK